MQIRVQFGVSEVEPRASHWLGSTIGAALVQHLRGIQGSALQHFLWAKKWHYRGWDTGPDTVCTVHADESGTWYPLFSRLLRGKLLGKVQASRFEAVSNLLPR